MIVPGCIVIVHLANPAEQHWGVLEELSAAGVTFRGINVVSFEDFLAQAARDEQQSLGFSAMFVPMFRVERIFLDQQVGEVESYQQRFLARTGTSVEAYLGIDFPTGDTPPS
ncbi:MAG: hypothetical protein VYE73_12445 [Acidobacteriota bacterium]|nr:hypothetical protein [Acidobacteriota bacterium]